MNPSFDDLLKKGTVTKDPNKKANTAGSENTGSAVPDNNSFDKLLSKGTVTKEAEKKNLGGNGSATSSASQTMGTEFGASQFGGSNAFQPWNNPYSVSIGGQYVDLREATAAPIPMIQAPDAVRDKYAKELQQRINNKTLTKQDYQFLAGKTGFSTEEVGLAIAEPQKFTKYQEITGRINNAEVTINDMDYLANNLPAYAKGLIKKIAPDLSGEYDLAGDVLSVATGRINKYVQGKISESKANYYNKIDQQVKQELQGQGIDVTKLADDNYAETVFQNFAGQRQSELSLLERKYPMKYSHKEYIEHGMSVPVYVRTNEGEYNKEKEGINAKFDRLNGLLATSKANDYAKANHTDVPINVGLQYLKYADRDKYKLREKAGTGTAIDHDIAQLGINALYTTNKPGIWDLLVQDEKGLDDQYPDKKRAEVYHKIGAELYKDQNWFFNSAPSMKELDNAASKLSDKDRDFYYKHIRPIEKRIIGTNVPMSGLINKIGEGAAGTVIETGKFLGDVTGIRSTQDQALEAINKPYDTQYQDVGEHFESKGELKLLEEKEKKQGLTKAEDKRKEELKEFTDVRSWGQKIVDGTGNLTGQVLVQAIGTKGLGAVATGGVRAAGLLRAEQALQTLATEAAIAETATNFGISKNLINTLSASAVAYGSSYDGAMRDGLELFPDDKDKHKRYVYANTVAGLNAATERIFKDEKVFDAFKREVAPNIQKLVTKIGAEGISKELFQKEVNAVIKNGLKFVGYSLKENSKETFEELVTSLGTSATTAILAPTKFSQKKAFDDAINTVTTTFLSGGLVSGMAGAKEFRANYTAIPMLSQLGNNPTFTTNVRNEINRQLLAGDLTQDEANEKFRIMNDAIAINKTAMPELNGKKLSEKTKGKYFVMLLNEKQLGHQLENTTDDVTKQELQNKIDKSKNIREQILGKKINVREDYTAPVPQYKIDGNIVPKDEFVSMMNSNDRDNHDLEVANDEPIQVLLRNIGGKDFEDENNVKDKTKTIISSSINTSPNANKEQIGDQSQSGKTTGNDQAQKPNGNKGQGQEQNVLVPETSKGVVNTNNTPTSLSDETPLTEQPLTDEQMQVQAADIIKRKNEKRNAITEQQPLQNEEVQSQSSEQQYQNPNKGRQTPKTGGSNSPIQNQEEVGAGVVMKPLDNISTDTKRFQPRDAAFNKDSRDNIVGNFNNDKLAPVRTWTDPNNGQEYVVSGHSRYEAHKLLSDFNEYQKAYPNKTIEDYNADVDKAVQNGFQPGKIKAEPILNASTEQEAKDIAAQSNSEGRSNTIAENAKYISKLRTEGRTNKEINDIARTNFGKNANAIIALSFLNPSGKTNDALKAFVDAPDEGTDNDITQVANWIGQVRQQFGERISNAQEDEMFDFLMKNKGKDKTITTAVEFKTKINAIVNSAFYNPDEPLNLSRIKYRTQGEVVYDAEMQEINNDISETQQQIDGLDSRLNNPTNPEYINPKSVDYKDVLQNAQNKRNKLFADLEALRKQKLELMQNKTKFISSGINQAGLFDTLYTPDALTTEEKKQVEEDVLEHTDGQITTTDNKLFDTLKTNEDAERSNTSNDNTNMVEEANKAKDVKPVQENVQQPTNDKGASTGEVTEGATVSGQERTGEDGLSELEKKKRQVLAEKKAAFKAAIKQSTGRMYANGIDPDVLRTGVEMVAAYVDLGIYKFAKIAKEVAADFGDKSQDLLRALKQAYGAYLTESDNPELDSLQDVKNFQFEEDSKEGDFNETEKEIIALIKANPGIANTGGMAGSAIYDAINSDDAEMQKEAIKTIYQQAIYPGSRNGIERIVGKDVVEKTLTLNLPGVGEDAANKIKPETIKIKGKENTFVGKNIDGYNLYEDDNGVRSRDAGNGNYFVTEPVNIIPTREGIKIQPTRPDDFKTIVEIENEIQGQIQNRTEPQNIIENNTPDRIFTDTVKQSIVNREKQDIRTLRKLADRLGINVKDTTLQEMAELAVVELSREVAQSSKSDALKLNEIVDIYNYQPSINMRSAERIDKQQYSTPAPTAFIAGMFVGANNPQTILEPSAGNGVMTIYFPVNKVTVNEIDKVRIDNLSKQGFAQVTNQDALQPFNIAKKDGVIMNPPFGSSKEVVIDGFKIAGLDEQMIANALQSLKQNGRAAIIMGGHNSYDEKGRLKADKNFFNYLYSHYNVADVINLDGKLYQKQGTTFPNRLILINGVKSSVQGVAPLKNEISNKVVTSFSELYDRVSNIKNIDYAQNILSTGVDANAGESNNIYGSNTGEQTTENQEGVTPVSTGTIRNVGSRSNDGKRTSGTNGGGSVGSGSNTVQSNANAANQGNNEQRPIQDLGGNVFGGQEMARGEAINTRSEGVISGNDIVQPVRKFDVSQLSNEKIPYQPKSNGRPVGTVIPTQMAGEADRILADIDKQFGGIDNYVQGKLGYDNVNDLYKALSAEQIDAVAMAIHQIEQGQGMIIGDMTGVGKGRIAASIVRYGTNQGKKPIFLTERPNLFSDLYRDLMAIGSQDLVPFIVNDKSTDSDPTITDEQGNIVHRVLGKTAKKNIFESGRLPGNIDFIMATYSQFRSSPNKPSIKKDFFLNISNGNILIMDESHNVSGDSNSGQLFQDVLANVEGVTYLSATFAKRPDNMPVYAVRTAMQEANMSKEELITAIESGGVALQEVVSSALVESGQMLRRERSFDGVDINYEVLSEMAEPHRVVADNVTEIIRDVIDFQKVYVNEVIDQLDTELAGEQGTAKGKKGTSMAGVDNTPFASKVFNVIDQLLFSIKAESVADAAIEELKAGRKPVIGFKSTMESFLKDLDLSNGEKLGKIDFSLTLKKGLDGTMRYTESDYAGNKTQKSLSLSDLSPAGQKAYNDIVDKIGKASLGITISPIDVMIKRIKDAGYTVQEITGRKQVLDIQDDGSAIVTTRQERDVKKISRDFNAGNLDVIMINASGATGISLHASNTFTDQRQRVMIDGQLELDINKAVQKRGRIDRTGQVVRGAYRYIVSSIPAEQRLLMMFKTKLKSLDANTTSSQKSKSSDVDVVDFLNKYGDEVVTEFLKENKTINDKLLDPLKLNSKSEEDLDKTTRVEDAARKVTGRVAILNSQDQEEFYKEITQRYIDYIEYLESNNSNDLEVKVLPLNTKTTSTKVIVAGKGGISPFGTDSVLEAVEADVLKKPLTKQEIDTEVQAALNGISADEQSSNIDNDLNLYYDGFMVREQEAITEDYEKKKGEVADRTRKKAIKDGSSNVEADVKDALDRLEFAKKERIDRLMNKYDGIRQSLSKYVSYFKTGEVYEVPTSIKTETSIGTVKGIFLGFKINESSKNPYAPSAIKMNFAVSDGRRKVTVPLSKASFVNAVIANSTFLNTESRKNVQENWDTLKSSRTRERRFIITGNLLQAYGTNDGQLVSYTDENGDLRKGLLLPEDYKAEEQKVRIPIGRALDNIQNSIVPVTTVDKEITISKERGGYTIETSLSKAVGQKYWNALKDLVNERGFNQMGGKMVAYFSQSKLPEILNTLQNSFGSSIEVDSYINPVNQAPNDGQNKDAWKEAADKLRGLKIKGDNQAFSIIPPFNLVPAVWNAAIEIAALTLEGGGKLVEATRRALNYVKTNSPNASFDEQDFEDTLKNELVTRGTIPQSMDRETLKMAKAAVRNVKNGSTIDAELAKVRSFFDKMQMLFDDDADKQEFDDEYAMFEEYVRGNVLDRPAGASINQTEAAEKASDMRKTIEEKIFTYTPETLWQKFLEKASNATGVLSVGGKILNLPNKIQEKTIGWLTKKGGEEFKKVAGKQLAKKNGYVRGIAKAMNSMISGMGKTDADINAGEKFQGEAKRRSIADAVKISNYLRAIVDNNKNALSRIDQLIDPEFYQYLQNMTEEEFAQSVKYDEPGLSDTEVGERYKKFRDEYGFNNPDYKPLTEDDLTPEEQSVYKIVRELYDFMHETNYSIGKLTEETYYANYKKYSARMYDEFELPDDVNAALSNSPLKMDVDLYMKKGNLTSWKALHKLQDPVYGVTKRLYQTLANKAIYDYAEHLATNRPDVISASEQKGFSYLGNGYGKLSNTWVRDDIAEDFKGYFFASHQMQKFYDFLKAYDRMPIRQFYKKVFTVYNPGVHLANIMGNTWFGMLSGINPMRLNLNLLYAKQQIDSYGEDYRKLLSEGVVGTDFSREDLVKKTDELFNKNNKPDDNQNIQQNGIVPISGQTIKSFLGKVQDFYGATDDVYKIAAYRSFRQLGYTHDQSANKVKQSFQNYNRVGKAYDVGSKIPLLGNPFGKFAGDLARIVTTSLKERPLTAMAVLASLQAVSLMISKASGEDDEKRRRRMNRPGVAKIPVPDWFPEWLGGGREGGISLSWKMGGDKELNIAKYLSPVFVYNSYDGDNSLDLLNKFSPLPIEGKPDFTYNPNGVWAVFLAKNANDPLLAPLVQLMVNSDFRGMPILDPDETKYRASTMSDKEKNINALRFLARAYVPHGGYVDDFMRAVKGEPDYYDREMTPEQIFGRFLGYKTIPFGEAKYDEVVEKRVRYWGNMFKVESAKMNKLLTEQAEEKITDAVFEKREAEILQRQAEIVSKANKEIWKMTGEEQYFEPPEDDE